MHNIHEDKPVNKRIARRCIKKMPSGGFPGGPVVRALSFHCRGHWFDPWSGNSDPTSRAVRPKRKKKRCLVICYCLYGFFPRKFALGNV